MQTRRCCTHTIIIEKHSVQKSAFKHADSVKCGSLQCFEAGSLTVLVPFSFKSNPPHVWQPTSSSPTPFTIVPKHQCLKWVCLAGNKLANALQEVDTKDTAEADR